VKLRTMTRWMSPALWLWSAVCLTGQDRTATRSPGGLLEQGGAALAQSRLAEAAELFQKAVDLDPSSAEAHQQLGVALTRAVVVGAVRPSADSDVVERAEEHLRRATELVPWARAPLLAWSELEAVLAERSPDLTQRAERYHQAEDLLKKVIALAPGRAEYYLRLAHLERDEFGPALQSVKARGSTPSGPIPDASVRHSLQQQYGALVDEAVSYARQAVEMSVSPTRSLLLLSRLLRERALLRETSEQSSADWHAAEDYWRQFLAAGGHVDSRDMTGR
jgi:tetratricopeptide (TPR) repeat protein